MPFPAIRFYEDRSGVTPAPGMLHHRNRCGARLRSSPEIWEDIAACDAHAPQNGTGPGYDYFIRPDVLNRCKVGL